MKLLIVGLFPVVCFGQPIDGRWCEKPCDSAIVGTFGNPVPTNRVSGPLNMQKKRRRVVEQATQPITAPVVVPSNTTGTGPVTIRRSRSWLPWLAVDVLTILIVMAVYLVARRRSSNLFTRKYPAMTTMVVGIKTQPGYGDKNTPLGPSDLNIAFRVIREFLNNRR